MKADGAAPPDAAGGASRDRHEQRVRVSVIMIFLDAARFLAEAIESVRAQTFISWELLLIDDGSTDESGNIARAYVAAEPGRIRLLQHSSGVNRGMSASRNLGIAHAQGEYLAFLDADDVWLPEKLERQVALIDAHPEVGMLYGPAEWWYSWTGAPADQDRDRLDGVDQRRVRANQVIAPPSLLATFLEDGGSVPCPGTVLVRRTVAVRVGGFEDTFRGLYEDQAFYAKVLKDTPAFVASDCWTRYRRHPASSTSQAEMSGQHVAARLLFLTWLVSYLIAHQIDDRRVWRALQLARWTYHPTVHRLVRAQQKRAQRLRGCLVALAQRMTPAQARWWLWSRWRRDARPPVGWVRFGSLRRTTPISPAAGFDRGQPIDRFYIDHFLAQQSADIRGRVLEIGDDAYTRAFGSAGVTAREILNQTDADPRTTVVGDLGTAGTFPEAAFDCIICTQTLQYMYDPRTALGNIYQMLKPGGVLLLTVPGISQISPDRWAPDWCWTFTATSARRLVAECFLAEQIALKAAGNVLTAIAFLEGLASRELRPAELQQHDPLYPIVIMVRAVKSEPA